jgi:hypothetical protein
MTHPSKTDSQFLDAIQGLRRGDFSRLEPLFHEMIVEWHRMGLLDDEPEALAEALTCACINGKTMVAEHFLDSGVDPLAGMGTGMSAFHWAANRGQLNTVEMLICRGVPLEAKNSYGGTVLGTAVWSAIHEPKADHLAIIDVLILAGASLVAVEYPTGNEPVDEVLRRHGTGG